MRSEILGAAVQAQHEIRDRGECFQVVHEIQNQGGGAWGIWGEEEVKTRPGTGSGHGISWCANEQRVYVATASRPARVQTYSTASIGFLSAPTLLSYLIHIPEEGARGSLNSHKAGCPGAVLCVCVYKGQKRFLGNETHLTITYW